MASLDSTIALTEGERAFLQRRVGFFGASVVLGFWLFRAVELVFQGDSDLLFNRGPSTSVK